MYCFSVNMKALYKIRDLLIMEVPPEGRFWKYLYVEGKHINSPAQMEAEGIDIRVCCCLVTKSCPTLLQLCLRLFYLCNSRCSSLHGISQARILEWVDHFLFQGIFPTQASNPHLLHWQMYSLLLSHQGSPNFRDSWLQIPFLNPFLSNPIRRKKGAVSQSL